MDLFFYGNQDILPPLSGEGRGDVPHSSGVGPRVCEACSKPVTVEEIECGGALELYGLVLCSACRSQTRARERIELYFCDRCHVSVPVYRVDTGEALAGDGRILCLSCRTQVRVAGMRVAVALLFVLLAGLGFSWAASRQSAALSKRISGLSDGVHRMAGEIATLADRVERLTAGTGLSRLRNGAKELEDANRVERESLQDEAKVLAGIKAGMARFDFADWKERMQSLESRVEALERDVESLSAKSQKSR